MFGFLKDKLKGAIGKLTKEVEKDAVVEKKEVVVEKKIEDKKSSKVLELKPKVSKDKIESKVSEKKIGQKHTEDTSKNSDIHDTVEIKNEPKKKGFFQRIFGKKDEEEDIIEEKEELRERAEKIIIEPEVEKKISKPVAQKVDKIKQKSVEQRIETKVVEKKQEIKSKIVGKDLQKPVASKVEKIKLEITNVEASEEEIEEFPEEFESKEDEEKIETEVIDTIIENIEPVIQKIEPKVAEQTSKPSPVIVKAQMPHHLVVEEERAGKIVEHKEEEHKGFFSKITETFTKVQISEEKFEELFWELEVVLLENNVAVEVIDKIKRDLKKELMAGKVSRKAVDELILSTLKQSITELFDVEKIDLIKNIKDKRNSKMPYIIAIIGVNGSGKTTTIAKLTHKFQKEGLSVVLAASDTFRAAAIQQLEEHANNLNVKIIKHDYNSDPAAVGFDAIKYAEAKNIDVVIIDTAGRLHSNTNLMRELEKVIRVCKPDIKIFVGESITGNDCVEQAKEFDKAVGIDAIILAKADVDDKGGAAISVSYILQRPILYLGTGQTYDDLKEFDSKVILESLEL